MCPLQLSLLPEQWPLIYLPGRHCFSGRHLPDSSNRPGAQCRTAGCLPNRQNRHLWMRQLPLLNLSLHLTDLFIDSITLTSGSMDGPRRQPMVTAVQQKVSIGICSELAVAGRTVSALPLIRCISIRCKLPSPVQANWLSRQKTHVRWFVCSFPCTQR